MNKNVVISKIVYFEKKLKDISEKVNNAYQFDSIGSWIKYILEEDIQLAKHFSIPIEEDIRKAIIVLIKSNSTISDPVIKLLANRIAIYISSTADLRFHPLSGENVKSTIDNLKPLILLTQIYSSNNGTELSIANVSKALKDKNLHIYKSNIKEPDLRVVLKTLKVDKEREKNKKDINALRDFLFTKLKKSFKENEFGFYPRHSWWAMLELMSGFKDNWIKKNRKEINKIVKSMLRITEYNNAIDIFDIFSEQDSNMYERIWVTINAIKIYKDDVHMILSRQNNNLLKNLIESNIVIISNAITNESIRSIQSILLLNYEALGYYNFREAEEMSAKKKISVKKNLIGNYIYDDRVIENFKPIKETIIALMKNRGKLTKHSQTSMLICGSPGQGKTELINQICIEIENIATKYNRKFIFEQFIVGSQMNSLVELKSILETLKNNNIGDDIVKLICFDEIDKTENFIFYTPFLDYLETKITANQQIKIWVFAQSSFPTFDLFRCHSDNIDNKSQRDFTTRIQLGHLDLPELKTSPQQRVYTILGYTIGKEKSLSSISRNCLFYYAMNDTFQNNRDIITDYTKNTVFRDNHLKLIPEINSEIYRPLGNEKIFIDF